MSRKFIVMGEKQENKDYNGLDLNPAISGIIYNGVRTRIEIKQFYMFG